MDKEELLSNIKNIELELKWTVEISIPHCINLITEINRVNPDERQIIYEDVLVNYNDILNRSEELEKLKTSALSLDNIIFSQRLAGKIDNLLLTLNKLQITYNNDIITLLHRVFNEQPPETQIVEQKIHEDTKYFNGLEQICNEFRSQLEDYLDGKDLL